MWLMILAAGTTFAATPTITKSGSKWALANDNLQTVVSFSGGSIKMTSLYNKRALKEYLGASPNARLFWYQDGNGNSMAANDGGWTLGADTISDIRCFGKSWGKQLEVTVSRTSPVAMQVRLVFDIYNDMSGLHYYTFIKNNNTSTNLKIVNSEVISLDLPNNPHTIIYANQNNLGRGSTTDAKVDCMNAVCTYNTGDGWAINPELNIHTSNDSARKPFGYLDCWSGNSKIVKFYTLPECVQLDLFPNEEFEYLGVNMTTFKGDYLDGLMAVEDHFINRYKFTSVKSIFASNDWDWYNKGLRTDAFYRSTCVPQVKAAGYDAIYVDDLWNVSGSSTAAVPSFTSDMPGLCNWIRSQGLQVGFWYSFCGRGGLDLADPNAVTAVKNSVINGLIGQYGSVWQQIDLPHFSANTAATGYSHGWDSAYRKTRNGMNAMQEINRAHPNYNFRISREVDDGTYHTCGLIHQMDNGMVIPVDADGKEGTLPQLFGMLGSFPVEGLSMSCQPWDNTSKTCYTMYGAREAMTYQNPSQWTNASAMLAFNNWKRTPGIAAMRSNVFRPVNIGFDGNYAWMYLNADRSKAMLIACSSTGNFTADGIRWLDDSRNYQVRDISYHDDGTFANAVVGCFSGSTLKANGLAIHFKPGNSYGGAYWLDSTVGAPPSPPVPPPTPKSAFNQIEAENCYFMSGAQIADCADTGGGQCVGWIANGSFVAYKYIHFGSGPTGMVARVASDHSGGNIEVRLNSPFGTLLGTCAVTGTGGWNNWTTKSCSISGVTGIQNVYLVFTGGTGALFNVNWFRFTSSGPE